jgi:multiple sugar transport system permease protein
MGKTILKNQPSDPKKSHDLFPYYFLLPYILLLLILAVYPVLKNLSLSLQSNQGWLANYIEVIQNPVFSKVCWNSLIWTVGSVSLQILVGLGVALLLKQQVKGKAIFRTIILVLPWATPDIVAGVAWKWMYNDMYGVFNDILVKIGLIREYLPWLGFPNLARAAIIIANVWKGFPLTAMFILAALQTIPESLYEAADIDGATVWQRFRFIIMPYIKPVILTTIMLTTIWTINYFPLIYTMTGGGPANSTDTFVTLAYTNAFKFLNFSRSAAISNISFAIILSMTAIYAFSILSGEEDTK